MVNEGRDRRDGGDSISPLPDEILLHIMSYIPTKFVVTTSALSKRWRHVWSGTHSLSFCHWNRVNCDSIHETLTRYTAKKMTNFQLSISGIEKIPYIATWIEFAMFRNVENISLELDFPDNYEYNSPDFFYVNSSVKQLSVGLRCNRMKIPSCSVSWTSLKNLSLCNRIISDKSIAKILSGCPILESLTLLFVSFLDELRVLDLRKSLRLRTLIIDRKVWAQEAIQIVAPHIHYLRIRDHMLPCTLVDVSSLTEANLDIRFSSHGKLEVEHLQIMFLKMLEKCQNVERLTLGSNFLKILSLAALQHVPFPMSNVKSLMLRTMVSQSVIPGIIMMLQSSPELKKLTLLITDRCTKTENYIDKCLDLQGLKTYQCWSSIVELHVSDIPKKVEPKHVVSFMELILKPTKTLEKIDVQLKGYLKGKCLEELLVMAPMLSRNNKNVSIVFRK